ncbi:MAG: DedA family protein [Anaerolineales bacterium]|jgi:membrane protein DedA with SNARE-associated domain
MFDTIETFILGTLQSIYDQFGWGGVFSMMIFENATGITPSEIVLSLAGWMLIEAHGEPPSLILLGGLYAGFGSAIGASVAYWLARLGGRPVVEKFARWFRIDLKHVEAIDRHVNRWGLGLVLFGRVVPGVRTLVSIPAGLARIPFGTFFAATFAGAYVWCSLLIGAGYLLGHEWMLISHYLKAYFPYLVAGGLGVIALYVLYTYRASIPQLARIFVRSRE